MQRRSGAGDWLVGGLTSIVHAVGRVSVIRAAVLLAALGLACSQQQSQVPVVAPSHVLELPGPAVRRDEPFRVVHSGPRGPAAARPTIQIVFSRPLRALDAAVAPPGIEISPSVAGSLEWLGTSALVFTPRDAELPLATAFRVVVPQGLSALDGAQLAEAHQFEFETPRPAVTGSAPSHYSDSESRDAQIHLFFNQEVEPERVLAHFEAKSEGKVVRVRAAAGGREGEVVLTPLEKWPLGSRVEYRVSPGVVGAQGPLAGDREFRESFGVHGPLRAKTVCDRDRFGLCRPGSYLYVELSNPVPGSAFAKGLGAGAYKINVDNSFGPAERTHSLSLSPELRPGDTFTLGFTPGLRDIHGQLLTSFADAKVVVGDYPPSVVIGFAGDSIPRRERSVGVLARNAPYELVAVPLRPEQVAQLSKADERFSELLSLTGARPRRVAMGARNTVTQELLDLDQLLAKDSGYGAFAVGVRYRDEQGQSVSSVQWAQRTDLGLTAKLGRAQSEVWVTELKSGRPVASARVSELGGQKEALTGRDGLARLDAGVFTSRADHSSSRFLLVKAGQDQIIRSAHDTIDGYRIPVATDFYGDATELAYLFPERDLFRPGESLWVKVYVRKARARGLEPVRDQAYELALRGIDGETLQTLKVKTNRFGAVAAKVTIPRSAPLGYFNLALLEGERELASESIQVAEFVPAEFSVNVEPALRELVRNEPGGAFEVNGSYLYGAPMAGAAVRGSLFRYRAEFTPAGSEGWITDDYASTSWESARQSGPYLGDVEATLGVDGKAHIVSNANFSDMEGPERVELEAEVSDITSRAQSGRASFLVHPADYYVALEAPKSYFANVGEALSPRVRALLASGADVGEKRPVRLELVRLRYAQVERKTYSGETTTVTELIHEDVAQCSATAPGSCVLKPKLPGHHVVRASSVDPKGRRTRSSYSLYVLGSGDGGYRQWDERGSVELKLDRASYQPGDSARVLVFSPFERARGWVTVERDDIIESRLVELSGHSPSFELKVSEAFRPNVHVGLVLLEERDQQARRPLSESYRFGYTELRVDPEGQRLTVDIAANAPSFRPRDKVALDLQVRDAARRPEAAEVTLFVVDEGVLALSGFSMPDPLTRFTQPAPLRVETLESRESLARLFGLDPSQFANKGDAGGGGDEGRSNFLTTAYFNPGVVTDADGKARVEFTLPDNIGRFRVMALVVNETNKYGRGDASITVNKPLMVRPQLPRFLRAGDEFSASAVLSSLVAEPLAVNLQFAPKNLTASGKTHELVELAPRGAVRVDFPAEAHEVGAASLSFDGKTSRYADRVKLSRTVQSPMVLEAVSAYGKTEQAVAEQLGSLNGLRKDVGSLTVTLSSSALVGLEGSYDELVEYPYECTEQLASRALPLLTFRGLAERFGMTQPKDARARVEKDVAQIIRRQRGDGGFGLWPESVESQPWASAYALWVLKQAQQAGYFVTQDLFARGEVYLAGLAGKREKSELPFAVFATFVLGEIGKPDPARVGSLFELAPELDLESRALLLWAASKAKQESVSAPLLQALEASLTPRGNKVEVAPDHLSSDPRALSSSVRTHAVVLSALLAARPDHPLGAGLVRALLDARAGGSFGSTQESAFSLLALDAYSKAQESTPPSFLARAFVAGKAVFSPSFEGYQQVAHKVTLPLGELRQGADLVFDKQGQGTLFYEARLKYARTELPTTPYESGFSVTKTLRKVSRDELIRPLGAPGPNANEFSEGDLVLVDLSVLAPDHRRFVVVEDPLPAGFEAIDFSLASSSGQLSPSVQSSSGYSWAWYRSELRDDRALFFVDDMEAGLYRYVYLARATTSGSFVTPPTTVHEMYQEEVMGRSAARQVRVRRGAP